MAKIQISILLLVIAVQCIHLSKCYPSNEDEEVFHHRRHFHDPHSFDHHHEGFPHHPHDFHGRHWRPHHMFRPHGPWHFPRGPPPPPCDTHHHGWPDYSSTSGPEEKHTTVTYKDHSGESNPSTESNFVEENPVGVVPQDPKPEGDFPGDVKPVEETPKPEGDFPGDIKPVEEIPDEGVNVPQVDLNPTEFPAVVTEIVRDKEDVTPPNNDGQIPVVPELEPRREERRNEGENTIDENENYP